MDTTHLRHFYFAYLYGIQGGAAQMKIDASAMSRGKDAMEQSLGYALFKEGPGRKLEPLPIAHEFFTRVAAPAMEGLAKFKATGSGAPTAVLRVGATEFIVREYLAPLVDLVVAEFPGLFVQVEVGDREKINELLDENRIDLAVVATDVPPSSEFSWEHFLEVEPVLATRRTTNFRGFDAALAETPVPYKLVCPPPCEGVCRPLEALLRKRGIRWPVTIGAGSTALVPWLLNGPDMVGLCVAARALERDDVIWHPVPLPPMKVGAIWRGSGTPLLRQMLALIRRVAPDAQKLLHAASAARVREADAARHVQRARSSV